MIAVILAGGKGTRLLSQVNDRPKPLSDVDGKPFLFYLLSYLSTLKFTTIILSVGHLGQQIIDYFGNEFKGMTIEYEYEIMPMGTGGAVKLSLKHTDERLVFVLNGDSFCKFDPKLLLESVSIEGCKAVLGCCRVENTSRYGGISISDGTINFFNEKGVTGAGIIYSGVCLIRRDCLDSFPSKVAFSLENDFFVLEAQKGTLRANIFDSYFIDIGTPEDYLRIQREIGSIRAYLAIDYNF